VGGRGRGLSHKCFESALKLGNFGEDIRRGGGTQKKGSGELLLRLSGPKQEKTHVGRRQKKKGYEGRKNLFPEGEDKYGYQRKKTGIPSDRSWHGSVQKQNAS